MKTNVKSLYWIYFALMFLFFGALQAQQITGIYLSGADFNSNKMAFSKEKKKKCKIKLHDFSYKNYVTVKYCDSVYTFKKDSIFGYKDNSGVSHRFYGKDIYPIVNQGEQILLYRVEKVTGDTKNRQVYINYYFSKDANSPILPLTINYLERAFSDNKSFSELLEIHFGSSSDLMEYDSLHKMHKINRLLELSKTHKNN